MNLLSLFLTGPLPAPAAIPWFEKLHETFIVNDRYKMLIEGFRNTILITLGALAIGLVIGTLIAVVKYLSEDAPNLRWAAAICDVYLTVIRGIPMVVLLLIFFLSLIHI